MTLLYLTVAAVNLPRGHVIKKCGPSLAVFKFIVKTIQKYAQCLFCSYVLKTVEVGITQKKCLIKMIK